MMGKGERIRNKDRKMRDGSNVRPVTVSVIIPVLNERKRIARVIRNARRVHPETEVIVVANGTTDGSNLIAGRLGARVVYSPFPLGHDVARSVGAAKARGEILLFLDGDLPIPTRLLRPFVQAVQKGADMALNRQGATPKGGRVHPVVLSKYALNIMLGRPDLKAASMTAVPHALHRRALEAIGIEPLSVPPKAMAMAVMKGLSIETPVEIPLERWNRPRGRRMWMRKLVVGDHIEAIDWILRQKGVRGGFTDGTRRREAVRLGQDLFAMLAGLNTAMGGESMGISESGELLPTDGGERIAQMPLQDPEREGSPVEGVSDVKLEMQDDSALNMPQMDQGVDQIEPLRRLPSPWVDENHEGKSHEVDGFLTAEADLLPGPNPEGLLEIGESSTELIAGGS